MSAELEYYHELTQALQHAYDTRYLTGELCPLFVSSQHVSLNASSNHIYVAVGFVVLFYDHLLTIDEEIRLVWHAPLSLPKIAFLFNRYMVLGCLLLITCGEFTPSLKLESEKLMESRGGGDCG